MTLTTIFRLSRRMMSVIGLPVGCAMAVSLCLSASAATTGFIQTGAGPYDYNNTNNWVGGIINGLWDTSLTLAANQTATFGTDTTLLTGLTFNYSGNYSVTLESTNTTTRTLTLGGDLAMKTGSLNLGNSANKLNVNLGGVTRMFSIAGNTLDVFSAITNGAIYKPGAGILRLEVSNPFAGGLTIANGSTVAKNTGALGNNGSGTVYLGDTTGTANSELSLGTAGVFNNPLIVQAGNSGAAGIDNYVNYSPIWAGSITLNNDLSLSTSANTSTLTVSGNISGSGALNLSSGGSPVILTGTNTYTGPTYLLSGLLVLSNKCSLASPLLSVGSGAVLDVSGLSSTFVLRAGQVLSNSATATGNLKGSLWTSNGSVAVSYNGSTPAFTVTNGTLTLSTNTAFGIDNSIPLALGTYPLITPLAGGSVAGVVPAVTFHRGAGHLQINSGELDLVVDTVTAGLPAYYVSPSGSDSSGDGSFGNPWQTVAKARDYLSANVYQTNNITVYLRGGRYELTNTLTFGSVNSGAGTNYITYAAYPGETPTLSGGKQVTGWTQVPGQPYWVASVPTNAGFANYFRQLYVNGVRADRARSDWIQGADYYYDPNTPQTCDGIAFAPTNWLKSYSDLADLRILHAEHFKVDEFPVTGITTNSSTGLIQVALQQPWCQNRYSYGGGPGTNLFAATNYWMVVNAIEELDEPGEWCLNRATHQVYYYPYSYESMTTAVVYAPAVETLVSLTGTSPTNKVQNLRFQGITFEHGNWFYPRDNYFGGGQAELLNSYNYQVPGEIMLIDTLGIQFLSNTIEHQGSCGIQTYDGARNTLIQGNIFYDLTGASVLGGTWASVGELCTNTLVADNVIRDTGMDFMAGTLVDNLANNSFQVVHNDMADSQYMGFHERNNISSLPANGQGNILVASNRIALVMGGARYGVCDGGSIYSFGVFPNSQVTGNDIYDINQPSLGNYAVRGLYQDAASYGWTWSSNVVRQVLPGLTGCGWVGYDSVDPKTCVAIGNYSDATFCSYGGLVTNIAYTTLPLGQLSAGAQAIVSAAGLEPAYTNLLSHFYSGTNLALGKYTWASSTLGAGYAATNAVNWNYSNYWSSAANDTNSWWAVDLGAPYAIQRLEVAPRIDLDDPSARQDFQVQGANDSNFVSYTVLSEQNHTPFAYQQPNLRNSWIKYLNNTNSYRYLRIKKTSGWNLSLAEFQVYGYPTSSTATTNANQLTWDAGAAEGVSDGGGEWYAAKQWWNGNSNQTWADNQDAVIGNANGAAGIITVTGGSPAVNSLTFNPATSGGYVLTGNPIQLVGSNTITANTSALISNVLAGVSGLSKAGNGVLTLSASNTYTGGTAVLNGTLVMGAAGNLGATGGSLSLGVGTVGLIGPVGNLTLSNNATVGAMTVMQNTASTIGADVAQLSVAAGKTLTASNFTVGVASDGNSPTTTALGTGLTPGAGGTLTVNGTMAVGLAATSDGTGFKNTTAVVDCSGLNTLNVTSTGAGYLRVGYGHSDAGTLTLANVANTLNVGTLSIGDSAGNNYVGSTSTLNLGNGTNLIQTPTVVVGQNKGIGTLQFASTNGSVTITGASGSGTADILVGYANTSNTANSPVCSLLLAGHIVNVSAGNLKIGYLSGFGTSAAQLTFDTGTFTANNVEMAVKTGTSSTTNMSTFTLGANSSSTGTFTLNSGGHFYLAGNTSVGGTAIGSLIINGGSATINSDITDASTTGASVTTLTLNGGTLDMAGHAIGGNIASGNRQIGTLNFQSGTLKNVAQINGGADLIKTGVGTLTLAGTNTYSGNTTVKAGRLILNTPSIVSTATVTVSNGALLQLAFTATNQLKALILNGVGYPPGIYNSNTSPVYLAGPGSLQVISSIPTTPTNLNCSASGNYLTLSWPTNYLGWDLQAQTNSLGKGLGTNWVTVPGSALITTTNVTLVRTNPAVFYRLMYQP